MDPLSPELLSELCHDLRGPLGAIGTWVHVLSSERADGETRARALAAITSDVRAMGALIENLSSLAATLRGSEGVSLEPIDLVPFLKDLLCAEAAESTVEATLHASTTSIVVLADPVRLRRAVWLFVSPKTALRVESAPRLSVGRDGSVGEITIENAVSPKAASLALARALIEAQGGDLTRSDAEGKSALRVRLPLV